MAVLTRIGSEHDLSLTQLRLLGLLRDRRPRMTDLAAFLGLDKSTMSGLVERAERRGLVARGKSPEIAGWWTCSSHRWAANSHVGTGLLHEGSRAAVSYRRRRLLCRVRVRRRAR
ncbi:MarR family transcriptional regulator [Nocardia gipuzkoensis]